MKVTKRFQVFLLAFALVAIATLAHAGQPKYVFFFLGDGMASSKYRQPKPI